MAVRPEDRLQHFRGFLRPHDPENAALLRDCPYAIWSKKYSGKPLFFDHSDLNLERDNVHRIRSISDAGMTAEKSGAGLLLLKPSAALIDKGILIDHSLA